MALEPLRFEKNWFRKTRTREENWDEIARNLAGWASRTNNNLQQLGLDINGVDYNYNNVGRVSQTTAIVPRLDALEASRSVVGVSNLALDLSDPAIVKIVSADGSNLSTTNKGLVFFNSSADPGEVVTREVTENMELTLTGCHWGMDTKGDLTDFILWIMFIDTGSSVVLGVAAQGGRSYITTSDDETAVGNVTTFSKVLVSTAISSNNSVTYMGWVKANFDDTGNASGENYWSIQSAVGDIGIGHANTYHEGTFVF